MLRFCVNAVLPTALDSGMGRHNIVWICLCWEFGCGLIPLGRAAVGLDKSVFSTGPNLDGWFTTATPAASKACTLADAGCSPGNVKAPACPMIRSDGALTPLTRAAMGLDVAWQLVRSAIPNIYYGYSLRVLALSSILRDEMGCFYFSITADFSNESDCLRVFVINQHLETIQYRRSGEHVSANANGKALP